MATADTGVDAYLSNHCKAGGFRKYVDSMKTIIAGIVVLLALAGCASGEKAVSCPVRTFPAPGASGQLGASDCLAPLTKPGK